MYSIRIIIIPLLIFYSHLNTVKCSLQAEEISKWANDFGDDLFRLSDAITKYHEIKEMYKFLNAQVGEKNPKDLLEEIKENILRMMDRKMDAIQCIQQKAEELAEEFEFNETVSDFRYYSSKFSFITNDAAKLSKNVKEHRELYLDMTLNNDTHFYNIAVNTSHSSVHVPTNVFDKEKAVDAMIQWSEGLDEVFVQNYNSDPALSWQYFGSPTGVMRHYPAKRWQEIKKDLFDCRVRTWFIEAATCTKDVVILFDNSGSMDGMGKHIAATTAFSILDTFSNNDYVNVLNYSLTTNYTVPCFENLLVQATRENIWFFKEAIKRLKPDGKTKLSQALEKAFELLRLYREKRGCEEDNKMCNQAIMIITDGIAGNLSETINKYIDLYNGSNIPRLFTYLIGKEVTNVEEIKWMACANRGYFTHVQSLEQVQASVLKYINVVARPLVLQRAEHPVSWTHAYTDLTYDDAIDNEINEPYRLLTSVAIPCFDNKTTNANLLGVAGTDVPLDDFRKLTLPYKIGVNAYAFIVSNNGYVLMHPDLRPVYRGILKENYNSIDLTEVEQHNNDLPAKEIGDELRQLRTALVDGIAGSIHNVPLTYHYNNVKRVSEENYDYYFTPLENTPFSIGIAIPNRYGNVSLDVGDQIQRNRNTGENLVSFFSGNWKIHPKWVYCKYHYLEGHEFATPEDELLEFLERMYNLDFKWERQYETSSTSFDEDLKNVECGRKTHDDDDYYCDKQLVQRLIFDACNTKKAFDTEFTERELELIEKYNGSLRFVATMSGLTRWEYIYVVNGTRIDKTKNFHRNTKEFGNLHSRAIDETWYKSAVLQHQYDTESFVYSVPFDVCPEKADSCHTEDVQVTGSYAIFPSDAGKEAPGSVVGFQFAHTKFRDWFFNLTTNSTNNETNFGRCGISLDCYVVDSSGYILISKEDKDTGKFFGEEEGDIMNSMLHNEIFKELILYDYQALCRYDEDDDGSGAMSLLTPLDLIKTAFNWLIWKLFWLALEININNLWYPQFVFAQNDTLYNINKTTLVDDEEKEDKEDVPEVENKTDISEYYACEKQIKLYILQQRHPNLSDHAYAEYGINNISRPYYIKKIVKSNLILVAINTTIRRTNLKKYDTKPTKISKAPIWEIDHLNTTLLACQKLNLNTLHRRPLQGCFNEHPDESKIWDCGKSNKTTSNYLVILLILFSILCI